MPLVVGTNNSAKAAMIAFKDRYRQTVLDKVRA